MEEAAMPEAGVAVDPAERGGGSALFEAEATRRTGAITGGDCTSHSPFEEPNAGASPPAALSLSPDSIREPAHPEAECQFAGNGAIGGGVGSVGAPCAAVSPDGAPNDDAVPPTSRISPDTVVEPVPSTLETLPVCSSANRGPGGECAVHSPCAAVSPREEPRAHQTQPFAESSPLDSMDPPDSVPPLSPSVVPPTSTVSPVATAQPLSKVSPVSTVPPTSTIPPLSTDAPISTVPPVSIDDRMPTVPPVPTNAPMPTVATVATALPPVTELPRQQPVPIDPLPHPKLKNQWREAKAEASRWWLLGERQLSCVSLTRGAKVEAFDPVDFHFPKGEASGGGEGSGHVGGKQGGKDGGRARGRPPKWSKTLSRVSSAGSSIVRFGTKRGGESFRGSTAGSSIVRFGMARGGEVSLTPLPSPFSSSPAQSLPLTASPSPLSIPASCPPLLPTSLPPFARLPGGIAPARVGSGADTTGGGGEGQAARICVLRAAMPRHVLRDPTHCQVRYANSEVELEHLCALAPPFSVLHGRVYVQQCCFQKLTRVKERAAHALYVCTAAHITRLLRFLELRPTRPAEFTPADFNHHTEKLGFSFAFADRQAATKRVRATAGGGESNEGGEEEAKSMTDEEVNRYVGVTTNNQALPEMEPPPGVTSQLRCYQKQALHWMLSMEALGRGSLCQDLISSHPFPPCHPSHASCQEMEPPPGVTSQLRCYQKQALHWMLSMEALGQTVPGIGELVPGNGQAVPGIGELVPGNGQAVPGIGELVPGNGQAVPGNAATAEVSTSLCPGAADASGTAAAAAAAAADGGGGAGGGKRTSAVNECDALHPCWEEYTLQHKCDFFAPTPSATLHPRFPLFPSIFLTSFRILADAMGLGKTVMTIALIAASRANRERGKAMATGTRGKLGGVVGKMDGGGSGKQVRDERRGGNRNGECAVSNGADCKQDEEAAGGVKRKRGECSAVAGEGRGVRVGSRRKKRVKREAGEGVMGEGEGGTGEGGDVWFSDQDEDEEEDEDEDKDKDKDGDYLPGEEGGDIGADAGGSDSDAEVQEVGGDTWRAEETPEEMQAEGGREVEEWNGRGGNSSRDRRVQGGTLIVCPMSLLSQWKVRALPACSYAFSPTFSQTSLLCLLPNLYFLGKGKVFSPGSPLRASGRPSMRRTQRRAECEAHTAPGVLSVMVYYGSQRRDFEARYLAKHDVVITTYGTLQAEYKKFNKKAAEDSVAAQQVPLPAEFLTSACTPPPSRFNPPPPPPSPVRQGPLHSVQWCRAVLDEAHFIKNRASGAAAATFALQADARWCLTGTPIQNQLEDVYSLLRFLRVQPWDNWGWWQRLVQQPYERGDMRSIKLLQGLLKPLMLRRTKDSKDRNGQPILLLPPISFRVISCEFSAEERDFYDALHNKSKVKFDSFVAQGRVLHNYASILEMLLRLRQVGAGWCCWVQRRVLCGGYGTSAAQLCLHSRDAAAPAPGGGRLLVLGSGFRPLETPQQENGPSFFPSLLPFPQSHLRTNQVCDHPFLVLSRSDTMDDEDLSKLGRKFLAASSQGTAGSAAAAAAAASAAGAGGTTTTADAAATGAGAWGEAGSSCPIGWDHGDETHESHKGPSREYVQSVMEQLKRRREGLTQGGDECPVCLEAAEDAVFMPCAHIACRECLLTAWRPSVNGPCPVCRRPILRSQLITVPRASRFSLDVEASWQDSVKVRQLLQCLGEIRAASAWKGANGGGGGEKSVVFSQWTAFLDLLEIAFKRAKVLYVRLDGSMSQQQRERAINEFRENPKVEVLLVSLKAGGVGLNLTAASHAFVMDPWWNPSVEEQAVMRVHRIGQTRPVTVTRFIVRDSVEERMQKVQLRKDQMVQGALMDDGARSARINELKMLFR
ncbi:unnamed protein product [Closterium sp. Naga37s-1]|nr:unnamed protein product [Closterium sp. Naga37s-1]